tara:strand:- start:164 stop:589 length:426 start_codon:yes stop_codon:yes gene_type:complete
MRTELQNNEIIIFKTNKHWFIMIKPILVFIFSILVIIISQILGFLVVPVFSLIWAAYKYYEHKKEVWIITNKRIIFEKGVFTLRVETLPKHSIAGANFNQTLVGRIFGYGNIQVFCNNNNGNIVGSFVSNPKLLVNKCDEL